MVQLDCKTIYQFLKILNIYHDHSYELNQKKKKPICPQVAIFMAAIKGKTRMSINREMVRQSVL